MHDIAIIGGGAAGMMAAVSAAQNGKNVIILEKNEKLGKKLFITGKGRCNITNACDTEDYFDHVIRNKKFMLSSVYTFPASEVMNFFESNGLKLKVERGDRVFPESDKSSDVISCFAKILRKLDVDVALNTEVKSIDISSNMFLIKTNKGSYMADKVIVATGGVSYPSTGSTGDGYKFAEKFGHSITEILPSLVPLCEDGDICSEMQGVSLKNVTCTLYQGNKKIYSELGEMLFTHFGVSGPIILSASTRLDHKKFDDTYCVIDLKPALDEGKLDKRILRDFEKYKNKQIKNALGELLLSKMIMPILNYASIDPDKEVNSITKAERESLLKTIKNFKIKINGVRDFKEAIITRGGVNVREIEPGSMQSKKCKNLYFAGEIIDVDAETGGFNLQVAFSSGYLAGLSAATE